MTQSCTEGARGGPRTTQNRHLPGSSGTGLMANHRATSQAKCRKHLKSSRPKDLGTGPTPAQAHLPGSTCSAPEDRERGAGSCFYGHFSGSPASSPPSHLKTNFPRPHFPVPSGKGLERHPPRSGLRIAAIWIPLMASLAVGDSRTLRGSTWSPGGTDDTTRQMPG